MEIKTLTEGLSVSAQIAPVDVAAIKDAGFGAIICNRPDGEEDGQPAFDEISKAAEEVGLVVAYQPIVAGSLGAQEGAAFGALLVELPGPVLAYCRSGARSSTLWSLSQTAS